MFASLVAPHGSTSHQENMNMNALKKTLAVAAALAALGVTGLVSTQASACDWYGLPSYEAQQSGGDCIRYRPIYDCWGNCIGHRAVNVCD
jgi:hypothetical protein